MRYKSIPPSTELMQNVIRKSKLKFLSRFEMVWGMPGNLLTMVINGRRGLPAKYWHIFYDFDAVNQIYANSDKKTKTLPKKRAILLSNKNITNGLRHR